MSPIIISVVTFSLCGIVNAYSDLDFNRIQLQANANSLDYSLYSGSKVSDHNTHYSQQKYDKNIPWQSPPILAHATSNTLFNNQLYKPREDPRLFYLSDSYIKETKDPKKINHEVTSIYPGREVVHATDTKNRKSDRIVRKEGRNPYSRGNTSTCVKCPHDRTLIARGTSQHVLLLKPRLVTCAGRHAPRNIHITQMFGPTFGTIIEKGSHILVFKLVAGERILQHCKMQVHVVTQSCPTPNYLISHCDNDKAVCSFTCRDSGLILQGEKSLMCGTDKKWRGFLPVCLAKSWCESPTPPERSHITCKGSMLDTNGTTLVEGSRCRVRCPKGWRSNTRSSPAICRNGAWTKPLTCSSKTPSNLH